MESKKKKGKKSADVTSQDQKQAETGEPTARLQSDDETNKSQALHDPTNVVNNAKKGDVKQQINDSQNPNVHNFTAMRSQINQGQNSTLSWSVSNADRVRIEPDIGIVGTLGSTVVTPPKTTTYTLIAKNKDGESRQTQRIEVIDQSDEDLRASVARADRDRPGS